MIALRPYQREAIDGISFIGRKVDRTGQRFGMLVAMSVAESKPGGGARWLCRCDCGREAVVVADNLARGKARSCGCATRSLRRASCRRHGHTAIGWRSGTYGSWHAAQQRCDNPRHKQYADYGGRGIRFCERWRDFAAFLADMGERPNGLTLDRQDPDGHYEPGNCRWATSAEQAANRRCRIKNADVTLLLAAARAVARADAFALPTAIADLSDALASFERSGARPC